MTKKLDLLDRESPLRVIANGEMQDATFHHLDGQYSYCTLDAREVGKAPAVFHLYRSQELEFVDGRWQISGVTL